MEYLGRETNRTFKKGNKEYFDFLKGSYDEILKTIEDADDGGEVNVLDIGCGEYAQFLDDLQSDDSIQELLSRKNVLLNLFGISADASPKPKGIIHYNEFIRVSKGLTFLPEGIQFDHIVSCWAMNYFGTKTFIRVVEDSVNRLKTNGLLRIYPFGSPDIQSSAFPSTRRELIEKRYFPEDPAHTKQAEKAFKNWIRLLGIGISRDEFLKLLQNPRFYGTEAYDKIYGFQYEYSKMVYKDKNTALDNYFAYNPELEYCDNGSYLTINKPQTYS